MRKYGIDEAARLLRRAADVLDEANSLKNFKLQSVAIEAAEQEADVLIKAAQREASKA